MFFLLKGIEVKRYIDQEMITARLVRSKDTGPNSRQIRPVVNRIITGFNDLFIRRYLTLIS